MPLERTLEMILTMPLGKVLERFPIGRDFFANLRLSQIDIGVPLPKALEDCPDEALSDFGIDRGTILREFCGFLETFGCGSWENVDLRSITILGGHDKAGELEIPELTVSVGEVVSIVGPTGSGKSRLLADIECLADRDTPTGRRILVDGRSLAGEERGMMEGKLVAQLSQNMNFVMDLTVREFLEMHATSRQARDVAGTVDRCLACGNELVGEKFSPETKVTQLSGGQSRALMIADTAHMSISPVVLIDEIENAGIDRRQAVKILSQKEKIVFISTHDPLLALTADKRVVVKNGGISRIRITSDEEKECLDELEKLDSTLSRLRIRLRQGGAIDQDFMKGGSKG